MLLDVAVVGWGECKSKLKNNTTQQGMELCLHDASSTRGTYGGTTNKPQQGSEERTTAKSPAELDINHDDNHFSNLRFVGMYSVEHRFTI